MTLDLLSRDEARQLFTRRLGRHRVAAEPAAVDAIIHACAGLPLALSVVAARAAANPRLMLAALVEELRETGGGLDALDGGDNLTNDRTVFSWSYNALSAPAARMFRLLGMHAGPDIGAPAAASLAGEAPTPARGPLTELTRAAPARPPERRPVRLPRPASRVRPANWLIRTDSAADRRAALHRLLDHYLLTAYRADELLRRYRDDAIVLAPLSRWWRPNSLPTTTRRWPGSAPNITSC